MRYYIDEANASQQNINETLFKLEFSDIIKLKSKEGIIIWIKRHNSGRFLLYDKGDTVKNMIKAGLIQSIDDININTILDKHKVAYDPVDHSLFVKVLFSKLYDKKNDLVAAIDSCFSADSKKNKPPQQQSNKPQVRLLENASFIREATQRADGLTKKQMEKAMAAIIETAASNLRYEKRRVCFPNFGYFSTIQKRDGKRMLRFTPIKSLKDLIENSDY